mgnify:FL=1|jgi:hypothetical protein|tara:strand:+ start:457 stop:594 length:138 start_codon:yes stop_codon:yes gene_type:complete
MYYEGAVEEKLRKEEDVVRKARNKFYRDRENGYFFSFIEWIKSFF